MYWGSIWLTSLPHGTALGNLLELHLILFGDSNNNNNNTPYYSFRIIQSIKERKGMIAQANTNMAAPYWAL